MTTRRLKVFYERKAARRSQLQQLPCSHYADVEKLKEWILDSLRQGLCSFPCTRCNGIRVPWQTLRHLAAFTQEELSSAEESLRSNCREHPDELKQCPRCARLVQRSSSEVLCVECPQCPGWREKDFWFCWNCRREWKGSITLGVTCPYSDCSPLVLLSSCNLIERLDSEVDGCPSVRYCPRCSVLMSHQGGCNYMICPSCDYHFCYRCLQSIDLCVDDCNILPNPRVP
ncbi:E3 ubiquitin-protein ligase RNF144B-like [Hemitrygon akajei]|uniref:E3 ubiquitin-protein ligase RNF144B-like n=1 Tax=Hemitrygon akajei TaxID=2704970 RepID=UPI003BF95563